MMAGMGVPDLLGTQGTYTIYSTRPLTASDTSSSRSVRMRPDREGHIEAALEGPAHPLKPEAPALIPICYSTRPGKKPGSDWETRIFNWRQANGPSGLQ